MSKTDGEVVSRITNRLSVNIGLIGIEENGSVSTASLLYALFERCPALFFELIGRPDIDAESYRLQSVALNPVAFRMGGVFMPSDHAPANSVQTEQPGSFLHTLFERRPASFFELIGQPEVNAESYTFRSVDLQQGAVQMDGVLIPETCTAETPVYFMEAQFQPDEQVYAQLLSEVTTFLWQNSEFEWWTIVVMYGNRSCAPRDAGAYASFLELPEIQLMYLDELPEPANESIEMGLIRLMVAPANRAVERARRLLEQVTTGSTRLSTSEIIEMIEAIVVHKFPTLSWQEVEAMFGLSELQQTRVYQQGREQGIE